MPKYAFSWYAAVSGDYIIEAPDEEAAEAAWDEVTLAHRIERGFQIEDADYFGYKEIP
jgi:hypothetical protein